MERPGDWTCPNCGASCFASKQNCYKCGTEKPEGAGGGYGGGGGSYGGGFGGGWNRSGGGGGGGFGGGNVRPGDWNCPACSAHNYASRQACFKCGEPKPEGAGMEGGGQSYGGGFGGGGGAWGSGGGGGKGGSVRPGDWPCPSCGANNFASRMACYRCGTPKP